MKTVQELENDAKDRVGKSIGPPLSTDPKGEKRRYLLEKLLGWGGMGAVYAALDRELGRMVAMKIAAPEGEECLKRFRREATAMAVLECVNVVRVIDIGTTDLGELYISMEYLKGEDFQTSLERKGIYPKVEFKSLCRNMLEAAYGLAVAHANGIVHRDVKPANLFLAKNPGGRVVVKVLDFGIARYRRNQGVSVLTRADTVMGTPQYMAPEQMSGAKDVGPAADQYSLGAIFYEALTGEIPYGRSPKDAPDDPDWTNLVYWRVGELARGFEPYRQALPAWFKDDHPIIAEMLTNMLAMEPGARLVNMYEVCKILAGEMGLELPDDPFTVSEHTQMLEIVSHPSPQSPTEDASSANLPSTDGGAANDRVTPDDAPLSIPSPGIAKGSPLTLEPSITQRNLIVPPRMSSVKLAVGLGLAALFVGMMLGAVHLMNRSSSATTAYRDAATHLPLPAAVLVYNDAGRDTGPTVTVPPQANHDGEVSIVHEDVPAVEHQPSRHGSRHSRVHTPRAESSEEREARTLRESMVSLFCHGQADAAIVRDLHMQGIVAPSDGCQRNDRRRWCRLCGQY